MHMWMRQIADCLTMIKWLARISQITIRGSFSASCDDIDRVHGKGWQIDHAEASQQRVRRAKRVKTSAPNIATEAKYG